jgi:hypothetical protein
MIGREELVIGSLGFVSGQWRECGAGCVRQVFHFFLVPRLPPGNALFRGSASSA